MSGPSSLRDAEASKKSTDGQKHSSLTKGGARQGGGQSKQYGGGSISRGSYASQIPLIYEGVDVTPACLNPYIYEGVKERQLQITESAPKDNVSFSGTTQNASIVFQATIAQQNQDTEVQTLNQKSYLTIQTDDLFIDIKNTSQYSISDFQDDDSTLQSHKDGGSGRNQIPTHISLILAETDTDFLFEMQSQTMLKSNEEWETIEEDNRIYDYLTKGKGRNRKTTEMGIQTLPVLRKARDTEIIKTRFHNKSTYVSIWEMFDTFEGIADDQNIDDEDNMEEGEIQINDHQLARHGSFDSYRCTSEDKQINKLVKSKHFLDALQVMERILANNFYNEEQKIYKGLSDPDPISLELEFSYKLRHLWNFSNDNTEGKCVTCLALNEFNEEIIAAGYGKYFFLDTTSKGMVLLWNIKNPTQSERKYDFKHPVTALNFSKQNPNLLAVGFYNGDLKILDVSKREIVVFRDGSFGSFEPLWCLLWYEQSGEELLMASYGNGLINRYQITDSPQLKRIQIMITYKAQGHLKGIQYFKRCTGKGVCLSRVTDAICLAFHPVDPFTYFIGTGEGVIHKCSTNYYNQHMDLFLAHKGPLYYINFSPFANKLFLTCSDDFSCRLWLEGISEPLVTSNASLQACLGSDWSPRHPTIFASIRGMDIYIWDMQRKMFLPQSKTKSPTNTKNTILKFTNSGRSIVVGDIEGNLHVFALEEVPITPFFPENLVMQSLKKLLNTRTDLLAKIYKQGSLNYDKSTFTKYFNN